MPNLLAIETSSPVFSIALKKGAALPLESSLEGYLNHVENLIPMIDRLLGENGLKLSEIDNFLIGRGPGSFTGLRVAFATLKAFRTLQKKDCLGALSLDMIAETIELQEGAKLAVSLDAYRSKIYTKLYQRKNGKWDPLQNVSLLSVEE